MNLYWVPYVLHNSNWNNKIHKTIKLQEKNCWIEFYSRVLVFTFIFKRETAQKIIEKSNLEYWQISDAIFNSEWCSINLICKKSISDKTNLKKSITRFFPFQSSMYNCFKQQFFYERSSKFFSSSLTMFN